MGTWTVKIRFLTVAVKEERERDRNKVFETLEMEPSTLLKRARDILRAAEGVVSSQFGHIVELHVQSLQHKLM